MGTLSAVSTLSAISTVCADRAASSVATARDVDTMLAFGIVRAGSTVCAVTTCVMSAVLNSHPLTA